MSVATGGIVRKLQHWDTQASVRVRPRRMLLDEETAGRVYFSPDLVPVARHPLVIGLGPEAVRAMQIQYLYRYLDFTTRLELEVVSTACKDIALGRVGPALPETIREEAFKLCTDEAHHAYCSDDMRRQVCAASGVPPVDAGSPQFLDRLGRLQAELPPGLRRMGELLFTVVSETLISSILARIPRDQRVVSAVRQIVADHAEDEGRHGAYFSQLFGYLWPRLSPPERAWLGPQLPHYILAFLSPDREAIRRGLATLPLGPEAVEGVIAESHPAAVQAPTTRDAARVTIRLFENHGVLAEPRTADEFRALGLL